MSWGGVRSPGVVGRSPGAYGAGPSPHSSSGGSGNPRESCSVRLIRPAAPLERMPNRPLSDRARDTVDRPADTVGPPGPYVVRPGWRQPPIHRPRGDLGITAGP